MVIESLVMDFLVTESLVTELNVTITGDIFAESTFFSSQTPFVDNEEEEEEKEENQEREKKYTIQRRL